MHWSAELARVARSAESAVRVQSRIDGNAKRATWWLLLLRRSQRTGQQSCERILVLDRRGRSPRQVAV